MYLDMNEGEWLEKERDCALNNLTQRNTKVSAAKSISPSSSWGSVIQSLVQFTFQYRFFRRGRHPVHVQRPHPPPSTVVIVN